MAKTAVRQRGHMRSPAKIAGLRVARGMLFLGAAAVRRGWTGRRPELPRRKRKERERVNDELGVRRAPGGLLVVREGGGSGRGFGVGRRWWFREEVGSLRGGAICLGAAQRHGGGTGWARILAGRGPSRRTKGRAAGREAEPSDGTPSRRARGRAKPNHDPAAPFPTKISTSRRTDAIESLQTPRMHGHEPIESVRTPPTRCHEAFESSQSSATHRREAIEPR